jgi:pimeloyl-ACP methyl ester carboxylesterase
MAGVRQETAVDGFRLAYDRTGSGRAVLLLHGWPGDRTDYREVVPLVSAVSATSRRWKRRASSPRPWRPRCGPARTDRDGILDRMRFRATAELGGKTAESRHAGRRVR